jgi:hypothetical protein
MVIDVLRCIQSIQPVRHHQPFLYAQQNTKMNEEWNGIDSIVDSLLLVDLVDE